MGKWLKPEDSLPMQVDGGDGKVHGEVIARLGKTSRAFACLQSYIFHNKQLSMAIKCDVYCACSGAPETTQNIPITAPLAPHDC